MTSTGGYDAADRVLAPPALLARLRARAAAAGSRECCGALLGVRVAGEIELRAAPRLPNLAPDATRSFHIPAPLVRRVERRAAARGLELVGFYHSHPAGGAAPSTRDRAGAWPGWVYVIIGGGAVRAWRLRADRGGYDELALHGAATRCGG